MDKQEIERIVRETVKNAHSIIEREYDPNNHMESIARLRKYVE
jgi:2-methylcitrate dehydratase PrpD